jgi:DNA-binding MarR family transcriptional regulator
VSTNITRLREKHDGELGGGASSREAVRLWLRLLSCTMVIEKRVKRGLADRFATTLPRFDILAALDRAGTGLSMGALGRALLVSNGNITGVIQTLVRDGDVAMATAPGDRRTAIVTLTDAGRRRFQSMAAEHHGWIEAMFAGLSPPEIAQLLALLDTLKISIAAAGPEYDA